jgi:hypothetical protein
MKQLTEDEFDMLYSPIQNHLDKNASFNGCMFETYGPELDFVISMIDSNRVVTIIEGDTDVDVDENVDETPINLYYVSGYHLVNRLGYLILDKPYTEEFEVKLD